MKIAWVTVRNWDDFCSTTTDALAKGLVDRGHNLTIFNSDLSDTHQHRPWSHVVLSQSTVPGRKAASLARSACKWFRQNTTKEFDVIVVDWPLAIPLAQSIYDQGCCVVLMDRSPPADTNILAKLQWRVWKKAWSLVRKGIIQQGFVVSKAHQEFVIQRCNIEEQQLHTLPAGVNIQRFQLNQQPFDGIWRFVYHGRLDKHRGVLALPMLIRKLNNRGIKSNLSLVGEGDAFTSLQAIAAHETRVSVSPRMSQDAIAQHLMTQHIGLLPMPDTPVWSIASPLKRSEYLAAGLMVYGIDHAGHRIASADDSWFKLAAKEDFHEDACNWMAELSEETWRIGSQSARDYAIKNCSWDHSVESMESVLQSCISDE